LVTISSRREYPAGGGKKRDLVVSFSSAQRCRNLIRIFKVGRELAKASRSEFPNDRQADNSARHKKPSIPFAEIEGLDFFTAF
jgi:hypothetical protein